MQRRWRRRLLQHDGRRSLEHGRRCTLRKQKRTQAAGKFARRFLEDNEGLQFDPQKSVPGLVYRLLCHLKRRLVIDRARRRILLTVLHKLLALFGRERIKGEALRILASAILGSGLAGTDLGAIQDNLADWTKKG